MVSWQNKGVNVDVRYTVEYIDNQKDWNYVCSGSNKNGEPGDRYKVKHFSNLDEAMTSYLVGFFCMCSEGQTHNTIYDVKLFEQVLLDGEVVRESWIEPSPTVLHSLHQTFGVEHTNELYNLRRQKQSQIEMLGKYEAFIKAYHAEENFKKFVDQG